MKIIRDSPGERLTLEGDPRPRIPAAALGCLAVLVLPFLGVPASLVLGILRGEGLDAGSVFGVAFGALFTGFVRAFQRALAGLPLLKLG